ncbi:MAG: acyl-CoA thioester hydrolase [Polyangiales bacterium]|jgi:acyl-CoA thioester hydrolase
MDSFGHVNNTIYFRWFEHARIAFFEQVGWSNDLGAGPILAKTDCVFRQPVTYPDSIEVIATARDLGEDRFTMGYEVISKRLGVAAFGSGRVIAFDYAAQKKAPIPADVHARIAAMIEAS